MIGPDDSSGSPTLEIHLLGPVRLVWARRALPSFPTRASKLLFSYLVLHRNRQHTRDALATLFWGDSPDREARRRLRTELWRAKQTLDNGTGTPSYLQTTQNWVGFDTARPHWFDVEAFEHCVRRLDGPHTDDPGPRALLEEASELWAGDFLEGEYVEWCLLEQDRLRALRLDVLERLLDVHIDVGDWSQALRCGSELLRHDPLVEHVHRRMMALHYLAGDRPRALRQFERCRAILAQELGVEPMHRTRELHNALLSENAEILGRLIPARRDPRPSAPAAAASEPATDALTRLEEAAKDLGNAQFKLLQGIRALSDRDTIPRRPRSLDSDTAQAEP